MTDAKPRQRAKAQQRAETLEQILDAAEYLFSQRGLYGVTLKDIAEEANVHTSLLHYYFEDKKAIFDAVFGRRAKVTTDQRMAALDRYAGEARGKPTVEGALPAYLDTDLDLYIQGGERWRNFAALGAQVAMAPNWGAKMFDDHFDSVVLKLIGLLKQAMPGCPEDDIFWGYHFHGRVGGHACTHRPDRRLVRRPLQVRRFSGGQGSDGAVPRIWF